MHVKREGSLMCTPPPPPPPSVSSRRAAGCGNEPSRWLYFCCLGKTSFAYAYSFCLSGSLPDCGLLNRLELVRRGRPTFVRVRVSRAAIYIAVRRVAQTHQTNLGFATPRTLRRRRSLLHPERRRAPPFGRAGLRNQSPL